MNCHSELEGILTETTTHETFEIVLGQNLDFSFFYEEETKTNEVVSAGMCIGYFAGIVEGHQIGWSSADYGDEYCENSNTILEIISIAFFFSISDTTSFK